MLTTWCCPKEWWKRSQEKGQEFLQIQPPRMWEGRSVALSWLSFLLTRPRTRRKMSQTLSSMVLSGPIGTYCKCRASYSPSFQWCPLDLPPVAFRRFSPAPCGSFQELSICLRNRHGRGIFVVWMELMWFLAVVVHFAMCLLPFFPKQCLHLRGSSWPTCGPLFPDLAPGVFLAVSV